MWKIMWSNRKIAENVKIILHESILIAVIFYTEILFCTKVAHLEINHVIECKEISQLNIGFMTKDIDGFKNKISF